MAQELVPDVILMDVNLGDQDGLDLTAELVDEHPELRVVVLTAHADGAAMRRAAAAGACALLPKDGSLPDLLNGLRSARPGGFVVHPTLLRTLVTEERSSAAAAGPQPVLTPRSSWSCSSWPRGATPARSPRSSRSPSTPAAAT